MPMRTKLRALVVAVSASLVTTMAGQSLAAGEEQAPARAPTVSLALERVGGLSYTRASASDNDAAGSIFAFGVAQANPNPFTAPRVGVDYILPIGLTVGASGGFGRFSLSTTDATGKTTTDQGSLFLYTFTPRVGYRIALAPQFDLIPRLGLTLGGGSLNAGGSDASSGVFALAISGEAAGVFRLTNSFNLLAGVSVDQTVAASASYTATSNGTTRSSTSDIDGGLLSLQMWLGIGGYL
jgi:hypothetical protein